MARLYRTLLAPAFALVVMGVASNANAAFSVATTVQMVNGATVTTTNGASSVTIDGAVIGFNDYSSANNTTGAIPSEAYTLTGATSDAGTAVTVTELITVSNNGATATFTETSNFSLFSFGLVANSATVVPTSQPIGGGTFTIASANATSAQFGQTVNNGAISAVVVVSAVAVPEPASIAMLGLGLVGSLGFAARRRLVRA